LHACVAALRDAGRDLPEPDPWALGEAGLRVLVWDDDLDLDDATDTELRNLAIVEIDAGRIAGLHAYQDAVASLWTEDDFRPAWNLAYPIPAYTGDEQSDQWKLHRSKLGVCLVEISEHIVLCPTEGNFDHEFSLCRAYMQLGYLPPLIFADLRRSGGRDHDIEDRVRLALELSAQTALRRAEEIVGRVGRQR
jgi:hypothetical protein